MQIIYRGIGLGILLLLVTTLQAAPNILVSIKPLQGIVNALLVDTGESQLLLPETASPHHYMLKPSDREKLNHATLFVFIDYEMESFLNEKHLAAIPHIIRISQIPAIQTLPARQHHAHEHHPGESHDHAHHHAPATDWHLWLDIDNAKLIAESVAQALIQLDPTMAPVYQRNLAKLQQDLNTLDQHLAKQLGPLSTQQLMVYHDAYQYLEKRYHLAAPAILHANPHIPLTPKQLGKIQKQIETQNITCLFLEPEFDNPKIKQLGESLGLQLYSLDPLGSRLPADSQLYFQLMQDVADALTSCNNAQK